VLAGDDQFEQVKMPMCGGLGSVKPADDTVDGIIAQLNSDLRTKLAGPNRPHLQGEEGPFAPVAVSYASQVVAGTNFFIKASQYYDIMSNGNILLLYVLE